MKWIGLIILCAVICCNPQKQKKSSEDKSFVSLVYHRFGNTGFPSTNISLENFSAQLEYLKANDFNVMTLSEAVKYLRAAGDPEKVAVITVDDGYKSFKEKALPVLKDFGFSATLFVSTKTIGKGNYLSWDDLQLMASEGIEIGNHSHTHDYFLDYPPEQRSTIFKDDVVEAQSLFKKHLGFKPAVFAYPYGEYSLELKGVIKNMGFKAAVAQNSGVMHEEGNFYAIPRFPMTDSYSVGFVEKVNMKALSVEKETPQIVVERNPPVLELTITNDSLSLAQIQSFIAGREAIVEVIRKKPLKIRITSNAPLTSRRTLYTVTVPSLSGKWYWHSHLWVIPKGN